MPSKTTPATPQAAETAMEHEDLPGAVPQREESQDAGRGEDKPAVPKRMNLIRFLQIKPQNSGIRSLLLAKFGALTKTLEDWEITLKGLLAKKTH
jgi:hypothetical protein